MAGGHGGFSRALGRHRNSYYPLRSDNRVGYSNPSRCVALRRISHSYQQPWHVAMKIPHNNARLYVRSIAKSTSRACSPSYQKVEVVPRALQTSTDTRSFMLSRRLILLRSVHGTRSLGCHARGCPQRSDPHRHPRCCRQLSHPPKTPGESNAGGLMIGERR